MLLKLYIVSVIACNVSLLFYVLRLRKLIDEFKDMNLLELIVSYLLLFPPGLIPIGNIFFGLTWIINALFISNDEFIEIHLEEL